MIGSEAVRRGKATSWSASGSEAMSKQERDKRALESVGDLGNTNWPSCTLIELLRTTSGDWVVQRGEKKQKKGR